MKPRQHDCLNDEQLLTLYYDETDAAGSAAERVHLAGCATCAAALRALTETLGAVADPLPDGGARAMRATLSMLGLAASGPASPVAGDPEVMTLDEVVAWLRLDRSAIPALLAGLPHFTIAGQIRVRRAALLAFVEKLEGQSTLARGAGLTGMSLRQGML